MTKDEAKQILNTVLVFGVCDCPREDIEQCLTMAIKALELQDKIEKEVYENKVKAMSFTFDKENRKGE